jgi:hypothetical protein
MVAFSKRVPLMIPKFYAKVYDEIGCEERPEWHNIHLGELRKTNNVHYKT